MGGKSTTSTQSVQIPPEVLARYNAVNTRAEQVAQQPFMQYPGQFVAGLTPTQQAGIQNTSYYSQAAQPYYSGAVQQLMAGQQAAQPAIGAAYESLAQAQDVGQQYGQAATQAYGQAQGMALPYYQAATQGVGSALAGAQPYQRAATQFGLAGSRAVSPAALNVGQFMSPYTEAVARTTQEALAQQQGQERAQQQAQAIRAGAFGGERAGLERANLARQQTLGMAQALAPIYQQGYGQALAAAQQQQGVGLGAEQANRAALQQTAQQMAALGQQGFGQQMGAAQQMQGIGQGLFGLGTGTGQALAGLGQQQFGQGATTAQQLAALGQQQYGMGAGTGQALASLGTGAQQAALQGAQAQLAAGTAEQQTQQADLTARYQQFLQERGYPFQVAQFLANIAMGTGALSGSTTTTTQPAGFFSDRRLKEDVAPVGKTFDGQTIYRYKYKGDDRTQIGLMADEVQKKKPDAVGLHDGYKTVDYEEATEDAARAKKAGGGLVGAEDLRAILEAQRAGFGPFGGGIYGGADKGMPMGKAGLGYVPSGSLPVPKLVTAAGLGAQRPSGLSEAMSTGRNIAEMAKMGRVGLFGEAPSREDPKGSRGLISAKGVAGTKGGFLTGGLGGTTTTTTEPGATPAKKVPVKEVKVDGAPTPPARPTAELPSAATKVASLDSEALGTVLPEETPDLATMFAARGGVVPSRYAKGGSINPYDLEKSQDMDYFPEEVLESGEESQRSLPKPGQAPGAGRGIGSDIKDAMSLGSTAMTLGKTAMEFLPMLFLADGGRVEDNAFAYGGLVPRRGYATDGTVEEVPVEAVPNEEKEAPKPIFDLERAKRAIAANESGGRYGAIGPDVQRKGFVDRAYGKYQVMGANIPSWTEEALGTRMTPEEYLANPEAQEKTFAHHFGKFATQHGNPYDAASVWFSGKPIAEAGNRRDVLKTTVPAYVSRFKSVYDAESDMPSRGAQPVEYRQGLGGGRGEEPTIGRESSLGDVADRFMPEGVPTSSNFWVPALGFVGSMLASNRPTLGGAIGEGIMGGVGAFQKQREQQADLAKVVLDIADKQFVVQPDPANPDQTLYFNRRTGQQLTAGQYAQAIAAIGEGLGVPRSVFGIGEQAGIKPPSAPAVPGAAEPKALPAPTPKTEAAPTKEAAPTETKGTEWMALPPDQVNWEGKTPAQAEQYVLRYKQDFGLVGTKDPDALAEAEKQKREQAEGFRRQGNTAMVQELIQEAEKLKERRQEYIKQATAPLLETAKKGLEQRQESNIKFFDEMGKGAAARAEAITQLEQLSKSLELLQTNRLAEWKANFQGLAKSLGLPIEDTAGMNVTQAQIAMKEAWRSVFSRLAEIGGQPRVVEIQGLKDSGANIALEPGANRKIIASGLGALRYADKYTQDAIAERERLGNKFDQAKFTADWRKENDRSKFTEEFEKNLAVRGDVPRTSDGRPDQSKMKEGYVYILEPSDDPRLSGPTKYRYVKGEDGKMRLRREQ